MIWPSCFLVAVSVLGDQSCLAAVDSGSQFTAIGRSLYEQIKDEYHLYPIPKNCSFHTASNDEAPLKMIGRMLLPITLVDPETNRNYYIGRHTVYVASNLSEPMLVGTNRAG